MSDSSTLSGYSATLKQHLREVKSINKSITTMEHEAFYKGVYTDATGYIPSEWYSKYDMSAEYINTRLRIRDR